MINIDGASRPQMCSRFLITRVVYSNYMIKKQYQSPLHHIGYMLLFCIHGAVQVLLQAMLSRMDIMLSCYNIHAEQEQNKVLTSAIATKKS